MSMSIMIFLNSLLIFSHTILRVIKGIGLFITKNQIESMGGSIEVESEPGKGTTFKIKLT